MSDVPRPVGPQKIHIVTLSTGPLSSYVVDRVLMSESQDYHFSPQQGWPIDETGWMIRHCPHAKSSNGNASTRTFELPAITDFYPERSR